MPIHSQWKTKPPPGTPVDWSHPLARGLAGAWPLNERAGLVVSNAASCGHTNNGALVNGPTWGPGPNGSAVNMVSASSQYIECGNFPALNGASQVTMFLSGLEGASNKNWMFGRITTGIQRIGLIQFSNGSLYAFANSGGGDFYIQVATVVPLSTLGLTFDGAQPTNPTKLVFYINGKATTTGYYGTPGTQILSSTDTVQMGRYAATNYSDGLYDTALMWIGRALTPGEMASIHANPWQLYAPPSFHRFAQPYTAVGSGRFTLGPLGAAGAGTFAAAALGSIALSPVIPRATGALTTTAAGSIALGSCVVAAAGRFTTTAAGSIALGSCVVAAAGGFTTTAAGSIALGSCITASAAYAYPAPPLLYLPYELTSVLIATANANPWGVDPERTTVITSGL